MTDFAKARRMMVDCQIRPTELTDQALLAAMLEIARERFVPAGLADVAYLDRDLPVDGKRALLKPMVQARMIQGAEIKPADRALDVACGTGYSSTILARLAAAVTALEDDAERARRCGTIHNVTVVCGPLDAGWPSGAPYDVILLNGACETEPHGLIRQLAEGGRLVTIMGTGPDGRATLFRKDRGEIGTARAVRCGCAGAAGVREGACLRVLARIVGETGASGSIARSHPR